MLFTFTADWCCNAFLREILYEKRTMKTVFSMLGTLMTDLYDDLNGEHCRKEVVKYLQHLTTDMQTD